MAITIPDNATEATRELFQDAARLSERARRATQAWALAHREAEEAEATAEGRDSATVANRRADARRLEREAVRAEDEAQQAFERAIAAQVGERVQRAFTITVLDRNGTADDLTGDLPSLAAELAARGYDGPSVAVRDEQGSVRGWVSADDWRAT